MADGTTFRLDTADVALDLGWHVESTGQTDEFKKDGVTLVVEYSPDDDITSVVRSGENHDDELIGRNPTEKHDVLRTWLAGRVPSSADTRKRSSPKRSRAPRLRWSREKWLHKPTQEIVDNSDPRVPRTNDEARKQRKTWYKTGNQANADDGHYRAEMDMETATAAEPTYTATWHPSNGPAELLIRGNGGQVYWACVRHHQAKYDV